MTDRLLPQPTIDEAAWLAHSDASLHHNPQSHYLASSGKACCQCFEHCTTPSAPWLHCKRRDKKCSMHQADHSHTQRKGKVLFWWLFISGPDAARVSCSIAWHRWDAFPKRPRGHRFALHEQRDITHACPVPNIAARQHARPTSNCDTRPHGDICRQRHTGTQANRDQDRWQHCSWVQVDGQLLKLS